MGTAKWCDRGDRCPSGGIDPRRCPSIGSETPAANIHTRLQPSQVSDWNHVLLELNVSVLCKTALHYYCILIGCTHYKHSRWRKALSFFCKIQFETLSQWWRWKYLWWGRWTNIWQNFEMFPGFLSTGRNKKLWCFTQDSNLKYLILEQTRTKLQHSRSVPCPLWSGPWSFKL